MDSGDKLFTTRAIIDKRCVCTRYFNFVSKHISWCLPCFQCFCKHRCHLQFSWPYLWLLYSHLTGSLNFLEWKHWIFTHNFNAFSCDLIYFCYCHDPWIPTKWNYFAVAVKSHWKDCLWVLHCSCCRCLPSSKTCAALTCWGRMASPTCAMSTASALSRPPASTTTTVPRFLGASCLPKSLLCTENSSHGFGE